MKNFLAAILIAFAFISNPAMAAKKASLTPMQLQSIQSKEFEVNKAAAFGAVMTVIQDLGYTVESADVQSGFITAASPNENKTNFLGALAGVSASGNTVMTAFLMEMPNGRTRIRLNFVNRKNSSGAYGQSSSKDKPILEPSVYQNAWERIDEALFVMGAIAEESSSPVPVQGTSSEPASTAAPGQGTRPPAEIKVGGN